jgi:short-subunit dehydrogenase
MEQEQMADKVALVTGASSGIGAETARVLLGLGYIVYAGGRRVDTIERETGRVDLLVNNAGYGSYGAVEDVDLTEGRRQFEVNLFGSARLTQLVVPGMRRRRSGYVINVSSVGGKICGPFGAWYHASKFAVEGFSDALRMELAPFGIHVVVIEPGEIRTGWGGIAADSLLEASGDGPYAAHAHAVAHVLERSLGSGTGSPPEVVAAAIGRAVSSRRPRTRYAVGRGAGTLILARRILPDSIFDRVMRRVFGT